MWSPEKGELEDKYKIGNYKIRFLLSSIPPNSHLPHIDPQRNLDGFLFNGFYPIKTQIKFLDKNFSEEDLKHKFTLKKNN
jgi:hypothetical protein